MLCERKQRRLLQRRALRTLLRFKKTSGAECRCSSRAVMSIVRKILGGASPSPQSSQEQPPRRMPESDVVHRGYLKKKKGNRYRKYYYVLAQKGGGGMAVLECYTNEKRFQEKETSRKHEVQEWIQAFKHVQPSEHVPSKLEYDTCWPVDVQDKGVGVKLPGLKVLHLTSQSLTLSEYNSADREEFPIDVIRKIWCTREFFCITLGRLSSLGSGELWMKVQDACIAENMHSVIKKALLEYKNRSEVQKTVNVDSVRTERTFSFRDTSKVEKGTSIRDRSDSLPSKTLTEWICSRSAGSSAPTVHAKLPLHLNLPSLVSMSQEQMETVAGVGGGIVKSPISGTVISPLFDYTDMGGNTPISESGPTDYYIAMGPSTSAMPSFKPLPSHSEVNPLPVVSQSTLTHQASSPSPVIQSASHSRSSSLADNDEYFPLSPMELPKASHHAISGSSSDVDSVHEKSPGSSCSFASSVPSDQKLNEPEYSEDDELLGGRPIRTSSVGSRPDHLMIRKHRLDVMNSVTETSRVRAYSVGSKASYGLAHGRWGPHIGASASSTCGGTPVSDIPLPVKLEGGHNKSTSVPALEANISSSWSGTSGSYGEFFQTDQSKDLFELDFSKNKLEKREKKSSSIESIKRLAGKHLSSSKSSSKFTGIELKRDKKNSESEAIFNKRVEIPSREEYYLMDFRSPNSHMSKSADGYLPMSGPTTHQKFGPYLDMTPRLGSHNVTSSSSLSSSSSKDGYVDMSHGKDSPSIQASPPFYPNPIPCTSRIRKISSTLNSLSSIEGSVEDEYVDFPNDLKNGRRKSKKKSCKGSKKKSDVEGTNEDKPPKINPLSSLTNLFTKKSTQNSPVSPTSSPVPKGTRSTPSPFSSLNRNKNKESVSFERETELEKTANKPLSPNNQSDDLSPTCGSLSSIFEKRTPDCEKVQPPSSKSEASTDSAYVNVEPVKDKVQSSPAKEYLNMKPGNISVYNKERPYNSQNLRFNMPSEDLSKNKFLQNSKTNGRDNYLDMQPKTVVYNNPSNGQMSVESNYLEMNVKMTGVSALSDTERDEKSNKVDMPCSVSSEPSLSKLNISGSERKAQERSRSRSGPGDPFAAQPTLNIKTQRITGVSDGKLFSSDGKAASACSSPVSYSPPTSPNLGSVSSLSEGGMSSASSTCTVVNVGLNRPHTLHSVQITPVTQEMTGKNNHENSSTGQPSPPPLLMPVHPEVGSSEETV